MPDNVANDEECTVCDMVLALAGALVGTLIIGIAFDLLSRGAISNRIASRFGGEAEEE